MEEVVHQVLAVVRTMKSVFIILALFLFSCGSSSVKEKVEEETIYIPEHITGDDYQLVKSQKQEALLVLFPCFPCDIENTIQEFNIVDLAIKNNISVLMLNFNQHLWLMEEEKIDLENKLKEIAKKNSVTTDNVYIGGFSGGGNVSLLMSDYLKQVNSTLNVKGVFIVDAPIDMLGLYNSAIKSIEKNYSKIAVEEAEWIVENFENEFGVGDSSLIEYEIKSPYLYRTNSLKNLSNLKDVKIRLYSEPDTLWWKENRQTEYEGMNAFYIEKMHNSLSEHYGTKDVEYITTKNKGYRSNGERHPHSWSIVNKEQLINWIKE